jgi:integrase
LSYAPSERLLQYVLEEHDNTSDLESVFYQYIVANKFFGQRIDKSNQAQKVSKIKYGEDYKDNDLIICKPDGSPYETYSMTQKWRRMLKKNSIRHIKLHGSRHSAISQMVELGLNPKYVQECADEYLYSC